MAKSVGVLTVTSFNTWHEYQLRKPMRTTVVEQYWLHPTKGWRRSSRTKTTEVTTDRHFYPRWGVSKSWERA